MKNSLAKITASILFMSLSMGASAANEVAGSNVKIKGNVKITSKIKGNVVTSAYGNKNKIKTNIASISNSKLGGKATINVNIKGDVITNAFGNKNAVTVNIGSIRGDGK